MNYSEENLVAWREEMLALGRSTEPPHKKKTEKIIDEVYVERGLKPPKHKIWKKSPFQALKYLNKVFGTTKKWYEPCFGAHDLYWLGHWAFIKNEFKIKCDANPDPQIELARQCGGWYWPFENGVVFSERPGVLRLDNEGRLHSEIGPAMSWDDGFSLYFWHGVSVPAEWITTPSDKLDPSIALSWENIEQRRCFAEIVGWVKVLEKLNPLTINEDEPEIGVLLEVDLPNSGKEKFLKVRCGTGRYFVLPVPKEMKTALDANAWTYGLTAKDLKNLEIRT